MFSVCTVGCFTLEYWRTPSIATVLLQPAFLVVGARHVTSDLSCNTVQYPYLFMPASKLSSVLSPAHPYNATAALWPYCSQPSSPLPTSRKVLDLWEPPHSHISKWANLTVSFIFCQLPPSILSHLKRQFLNKCTGSHHLQDFHYLVFSSFSWIISHSLLYWIVSFDSYKF